MTIREPELISIIEGPTPDFRPAMDRWLQSVHETPMNRGIAMCQLRTMNGPDIVARCQDAWHEHRSVKLEFPDEMRLPQQVDVVAMRLDEVDAGQMLYLWVSLPVEMVFMAATDDDLDDDVEADDFDDDDLDDGFDFI